MALTSYAKSKVNINMLANDKRSSLLSWSVDLEEKKFCDVVYYFCLMGYDKPLLKWRHDAKYNDTQSNDIQGNNKKRDTQHNGTSIQCYYVGCCLC